MDLFELDQACFTLFGKGVNGYGINQRLARLCKCSEGAVRSWKSGRKNKAGDYVVEPGVPSTPAELIRVKVLNKEISER